jgi:acylphosphatase
MPRTGIECLFMDKVEFARLKVKGRVQGVFYRQTTKDKAKQLSIQGWVANADDGSVVIEAVGPKVALESLINWCWQGPPSSKVDSVDVQFLADGTEKPMVSGFEIRPDIVG